MLHSKPLSPAIADSVLLGLAVLADADADTPVLEASTSDTAVGLLSVAKVALHEVMAATGQRAGAALAKVRSTGLNMQGDNFADAAETMWAAGYLEASCEWPDVYAANAVAALHFAAGGLSGAATILLMMVAEQCGVTEQDVVASIRAHAVESLATAPA